MSNPLYNSFARKSNPQIDQFISRVREVQRTFSGNPKEEVQRLMNAGRLSQQQFNQYAQMANQIMSYMGK